MQPIYLDNNATTKPFESVSDTVYHALKNFYGNPSSITYELGRESRKIIDRARDHLAKLLDCNEDQIIFNSGGTESIYSALLGTAKTGIYSSGIFISNVEHPAVIESTKLVNELFNIPSNKIEINEILKSNFTGLENKGTHIFSVMYANNETGIINPIESLKNYLAAGPYFHSDIVQAVGKIKVSFQKSGLDAVSLSAHKFGGPKGIGALILKSDLNWQPIFTGGGQERGRRGGTENVALIAGLGEAARVSKLHLDSGREDEIGLIRNRFEEILTNSIKDLVIVGKNFLRLPNTSCLIIPQIIGFHMVEELASKGVYISAGSACKTSTVEPSKNLLAMGYSPLESLGMLRVSFGFENTIEEAESAAEIIKTVVKNHQRLAQNRIKEILNGKQ